MIKNIKKKKLTILFTSFPDFSGNSRALYKYMIKKYNKQMNLIWVVETQSAFNALSEKGIKCIFKESEEFCHAIDKADLLFDTHGQFSNLDLKNKIYVNLWHGIPIKKIGYWLDKKDLTEMDIVFLNNVSNKTDLLTTPSQFSSSLLSVAFNIKIEKVLTLGMPRLDDFSSDDLTSKFEKIIKTKKQRYKKIIIYLPTFRQGCGRYNDGTISNNNILNLNDYDETILLKYLKGNDYLMLVKHHPSEETEIFKTKSGNLVYFNDSDLGKYDMSLNELLKCTDMLITDYSSVFIEYLALSKPIIFLDTDISIFERNRGLILKDKDLWFPGPCVSNIKTFVLEAQKLLQSDSYFKERRDKLKTLFLENSNNNCKKLCEHLFEKNNFSNKSLSILDSKSESERGFSNNEKMDLEEQNLKLDRDIEELNKKLDNIYNSKAYYIYDRLKKVVKIFNKK
ncbi:MAG TPA: hypothetical protein GX708_04300 [Gallicola sp.]|nr:hypothetical protein [Gallicola sp.]